MKPSEWQVADRILSSSGYVAILDRRLPGSWQVELFHKAVEIPDDILETDWMLMTDVLALAFPPAHLEP